MNRNEHLQWCKDRALEYVDIGDTNQALASMMSDLGKHEETKSSASICMLGMAHVNSTVDMRRFIKGFN